MRPLFPTVSPSRRCLCPLTLLILHSLRASHANSAKITCAFLFTLRKRATHHLASFQSLPHSYPGGSPLLAKIRPSVSPGSASDAFQNGAPQRRPGKRTGSGRYSLCLYFVTSLLPYSPPRNLIRRLIILWRRDTEPTLAAWVYTPVSGFVFEALA